MKNLIEGGAGFGVSIFSNKKVFAVLLISILVASAFYAGYVSAPTGTTYTVSSGVYSGAPSYTIWIEGSNYFAKEAYGSQPAWSGGTNASYVLNSAFSALGSTGGQVYLTAGTYTLDSTITLGNNTHLIGESKRAVKLYSTIASTDPLISSTGASPYPAVFGISIENLYIYGTDNGGDGIYLCRATRDSRIVNVEVSDMAGHGIHLNHSNGIQIVRVNCWSNVKSGIFVSNKCHGIGFYHSTGNANTEYGLHVDASISTTSQITIVGGNYEQNDMGDMYLDRVKAVAIVGVYFENGNGNVSQLTITDDSGASLSRSVVVEGCYFNGGSKTYNNTAIFLNRTQSSYIGFNYIQQVDVAINLTVNSDYNVLEDNQVISVNTQIDDNGASNKKLHASYEWAINVAHPTTTGWGADEQGRFWFCTTHFALEYWNSTHIITP